MENAGKKYEKNEQIFNFFVIVVRGHGFAFRVVYNSTRSRLTENALVVITPINQGKVTVVCRVGVLQVVDVKQNV